MSEASAPLPQEVPQEAPPAAPAPAPVEGASPVVAPRIILTPSQYVSVFGAGVVLMIIYAVWLGGGVAPHGVSNATLPYGYRLKFELDGEPDPETGYPQRQVLWETYLLCQYVGTPEAAAWLRDTRHETGEDRQPLLRSRPERKEERKDRCIAGQYYSLGWDTIPEAHLADMRKSWPLAFAALSGKMPMATYASTLVAAARALGPAGLAALRPELHHVFFQLSARDDVPAHAVATDGARTKTLTPA